MLKITDLIEMFYPNASETHKELLVKAVTQSSVDKLCEDLKGLYKTDLTEVTKSLCVYDYKSNLKYEEFAFAFKAKEFNYTKYFLIINQDYLRWFHTEEELDNYLETFNILAKETNVFLKVTKNTETLYENLIEGICKESLLKRKHPFELNVSVESQRLLAFLFSENPFQYLAFLNKKDITEQRFMTEFVTIAKKEKTGAITLENIHQTQSRILGLDGKKFSKDNVCVLDYIGKSTRGKILKSYVEQKYAIKLDI